MHPDALLKDAMQASPVALRRFPADDELGLFAEVYDNAASSPHKVDITTTITADDSKVVFKADEERSSTDIQGEARRLRVLGEDSAAGDCAGDVRAAGRGAVAPRPGSRGAPGRAVYDSVGRGYFFLVDAAFAAGSFGTSSDFTRCVFTVPLACEKFQLFDVIFGSYGVWISIVLTSPGCSSPLM